MRRPLYLTTLLLLQVALVVGLPGPLARAIGTHAALGQAPAGWPALSQLVAAAAAVAGATLVLATPGLALACHRREGTARFRGLPGWAVTLALGGTAVLATSTIALACVPALSIDAQMTLVLVVRPAIAGGMALAAAGVLGAEVLRPGVARA